MVGIIAPCNWDQDHNIIAIEIASPGEEVYLVEDNEKGQELFKYLHEQVRVLGTVKKDRKGNQIISIQEYKILSKNSEKSSLSF